MLTGESGVGKERFARMIHLASERRDSPFVCVNCAAIPEQLLETELFGHEKGAFTGADKARYGKFELASDGTVFLDEIGDMNLELQAKLLRVLQEKSIQRVGSNREIKTNVRVIAATNINLDDAINQGAFRLDLYYRLNVIRIQLPPLRERDGDIRLLANYFLNRENQRYKRNIVFAPSALNKLEAYTWPGNIRQLENVVERAVIMAEHDVIYEDDIDMILQEEASIRIDTQPIPSEDNNADMDRGGAYCDVRPYSRVRDDERKKILQAIRQAKGNKTRAARDLGLTARQLRYRLEKLQLN
jgi:Nif-specific regulatory protein